MAPKKVFVIIVLISLVISFLVGREGGVNSSENSVHEIPGDGL